MTSFPIVCTMCSEPLPRYPIELDAVWQTLRLGLAPRATEQQRLCSTACARLVLEQWGHYLDDLNRGWVARQ